MAVGAAVQQRKRFYAFLAVGHIQRQNQPPCSVVAADFEDGVGRRRLMSRFRFWRRGGFFLVLFAAATIRVREGMMGNLAFVADDRRRAGFHQMAGFQASEAKTLVFVEFSPVGGAHLAIYGTFLQFVHGVASKALTWRRLF